MTIALAESPPTGLLGFLEDTRVRLPLKAIDLVAHITGDTVAVELEQVFLQEHAAALDCSFAFPLPADAAVHRCEMWVGGRVIEAQVRPREEARRTFEEQRRAGRRAALAERDRENLFNLRLGNLQPGELVRVRFAYVQPLERVDELRRLRIPLTPSERYVPGRPLPGGNQGGGTADDTDRVPDASRVSPPRIDDLHPDAASLQLKVIIDGSPDERAGLRSASHRVRIDARDERTTVRLDDEEEIPNRDFVLQWSSSPARETRARAWLTEFEGGSYGMLELQGASDVSAVGERDIYILLDRSGSMGGAPWRAASRAVHEFARRLSPETRIDLTLFESQVTPFHGEPLSASRFLEVVGDDGAKLAALGVAGGTELGPALRTVFERRHRFSPGRPAVVLLISDGMVADEGPLLTAVRAGDTILHLVGIGFAPNDALRSLAESTGGQAVFATPDESLVPIVARFSSRLGAPVLSGIELPDGWSAASGEALVGLYPGEQRAIPISGPAGRSPQEIRATGREAPVVMKVDARSSRNEALAQLWARERIRDLERRGDPLQATELALRFNLASADTSFVAWDRAEQVAVAREHLHQPALEVARPAARPAASAVLSHRVQESRVMYHRVARMRSSEESYGVAEDADLDADSHYGKNRRKAVKYADLGSPQIPCAARRGFLRRWFECVLRMIRRWFGRGE